jgi:hypothetical protein
VGAHAAAQEARAVGLVARRERRHAAPQRHLAERLLQLDVGVEQRLGDVGEEPVEIGDADRLERPPDVVVRMGNVGHQPASATAS